MIFHYFVNKLGLYEFLFEKATEFINEHFNGLGEQINKLDFIEQYQYLSKIKLQAYKVKPYVFEFLAKVYMHNENINSEKVKTLYKEIYTLRNYMMETVNLSNNTECFRDDIDINRAKQYIIWIFDGFTQSILTKLNNEALADLDMFYYWDEFDNILNELKKLFYRHK